MQFFSKLLITKYLILSAFVFLLLVTCCLILVTNSMAADPIPQPYIPCSNTSDTEFHSDRPYQASPCQEPPGADHPPTGPTALLCGNDLVIKQTFKVTPSGNCQTLSDGTLRCTYTRASSANVSINLANAELPIAGNTEDIPNIADKEGTLDNAQRVNNYLANYLNGALTPEEEKRKSFRINSDRDTPEEDRAYLSQVINFSGPLRKLLPWSIQAAERTKTIQDAITSRFNNADVRHDQIVGCVVQGVGDAFPANCLTGPANDILQGSLTFFTKRLSDWLSHLPPLEWESATFGDYWRKFIEWNDSPLYCIGGLCSSLRPMSWWANLFHFVPMASTEDKKGEVDFQSDPFTQGQTPTLVSQPESESVKITSLNFSGNNIKKYLYFPHMEENAHLGELLQNTFKPKDETGFFEAQGSQSPYNTGRCEILDSRTNKGDDVFGEYNGDGQGDIGGNVAYTTTFSCDFVGAAQCQNSCNNATPEDRDKCISDCKNSTCTKDIYVAAGSIYTKLPKGDEVWQRFVDGAFGVFKKMFPKVGPNTPVTEIKDLPAVTQANYSASGENVNAVAGDPSRGRSGESAQIFFAHLGGVSEYFLKGIQTALRPQGFSDQPISGTGTTPGAPGSPESPPAAGNPGSCSRAREDSPCGIGALLSYFGNDQRKAGNASRICQAESGANAVVVRDTCVSSGDVSVGLFQINIRAHSLVDPATGENLACPAAFEDGSANKIGNCNVVNHDLKNRCIAALRDHPDYQKQKAAEISKGGTDWSQWSTRACAIE